MKPKSFYKSSYVSARLENSIMIGVYEKKIVIDIDLAKQIVKERLTLFAGKTYPVLVDARHVKVVTPEARRYFAKEGVEGMSALAVVVGNFVSVIGGNLFMQFSKNRVPTKLFRTKDQALKWLSQFVVK